MTQSLLQQILAKYPLRGLSNCIALAPRTLSDERLADYCVPVRIHGDNESRTSRSDRERPDRQGIAWEDQNALAGAPGVFLNGWLRRYRRRVVLRGEPGEGKTTALWLFAAELCSSLAAALQADDSGPKSHALGIPLVLPLNIWDGETDLIDAAIGHAVRLCGLPGAEACLRECVGIRSCVLLLDGLDELSARLIPTLRLKLAHVVGPAVISTRYHVNPDEIVRDYDRAAMAPLSDWMVGDFIARYFADGDADAAGRLQALLRNVPSLRVMVRNPLLLAALCYSSADGGAARLPTTRCGLLEAAQRRMIRRAHGKRGERASTGVENAKLTTLARIAWHSQQERPEAVRREDLVPFLAASCADLFAAAGAKDADELVESLLTDGILVRPGDGPCRFLARPFHEFGVARHLRDLLADRRLTETMLPGPLAAWPDNRGKPTALIPLLAPGWTNIWPLVAGFGGPAEELMSVMMGMWRQREDLVHSRLWMLSVALGEYCRHVDSSGSAEVEALVREVSDAVVGCCQQEEASSLGWWRIAAARLPSVPVVEAVRRSSSGVEIASSLLRALGELGTHEAAEFLLEQVRTAEGKGLSLSYPSQVYRALGFVGGDRCKAILRERLGRGGGWAAYGCVQGLAQIGDPDCISALAALARDPRTADQLRWHTIQQCERLGGPQVEAMVLEQMMPLVERISTTKAHLGGRHAEDAGHLEVCVEILGRIGTPHAARALVGILDKSMPENIRRTVCTAIAMCGDSQSREELRRRIQDPGPHSQLSNWAALACVVAGDESCLEMLLTVGADAESCPEHLRVELVKAAGQSASPAAAEFLRDRLVHDTCETVRVLAAEALTGHPGTATVEALEGVLRQSDVPRGELLASYISLWQLGAGEHETARRIQIDPSGLDSAALKRLLRALGAARTSGGRAMVMAIRGRSDAAASECLHAMAEIQRRDGYRPMPAGSWESPFAEHETQSVGDTNFYGDDDQQFLDDLYGGMSLDHSHRKYWLAEIKFDFNRNGWGWIEEFSNQKGYAARLHQQFRTECRWDVLRRHVMKLAKQWSYDSDTVDHLAAIQKRLETMAAKPSPRPSPPQNAAPAAPVSASDTPAVRRAGSPAVSLSANELRTTFLSKSARVGAEAVEALVGRGETSIRHALDWLKSVPDRTRTQDRLFLHRAKVICRHFPEAAAPILFAAVQGEDSSAGTDAAECLEAITPDGLRQEYTNQTAAFLSKCIGGNFLDRPEPVRHAILALGHLGAWDWRHKIREVLEASRGELDAKFTDWALSAFGLMTARKPPNTGSDLAVFLGSLWDEFASGKFGRKIPDEREWQWSFDRRLGRFRTPSGADEYLRCVGAGWPSRSVEDGRANRVIGAAAYRLGALRLPPAVTPLAAIFATSLAPMGLRVRCAVAASRVEHPATAAAFSALGEADSPAFWAGFPVLRTAHTTADPAATLTAALQLMSMRNTIETPVVARAIGLCGTDQHIAMLESATLHTKGPVRGAARLALARLTGPRHLGALAAALDQATTSEEGLLTALAVIQAGGGIPPERVGALLGDCLFEYTTSSDVVEDARAVLMNSPAHRTEFEPWIPMVESEAANVSVETIL